MNSFSQGRHDGLRGLTPVSADADYMEGWNAGKRRASRGWKQGSTKAQHRQAAKAAQDRYGVKFYRTVKRCPRCRTMNLKRNKEAVCLHCLMKIELQTKGAVA